jgi:hypothetical protein
MMVIITVATTIHVSPRTTLRTPRPTRLMPGRARKRRKRESLARALIRRTLGLCGGLGLRVGALLDVVLADFHGETLRKTAGGECGEVLQESRPPAERLDFSARRLRII